MGWIRGEQERSGAWQRLRMVPFAPGLTGEAAVGVPFQEGPTSIAHGAFLHAARGASGPDFRTGGEPDLVALGEERPAAPPPPMALPNRGGRRPRGRRGRLLRRPRSTRTMRPSSSATRAWHGSVTPRGVPRSPRPRRWRRHDGARWPTP